MEAFAVLAIIGIVCFIAAIVGGNVRFPGVHLPGVESSAARTGLAAVGIVSVGSAIFVLIPHQAVVTTGSLIPTAPPTSTNAPRPSPQAPPASPTPRPAPSIGDLSRADLVKKADAACRRAKRAMAGLQDQNEADPMNAVEAAIQISASTKAEVAAMDVRDEDSAAFKEVLRTWQSFVNVGFAAIQAYRADDPDSFQLLSAELERANTAAEHAARRFGLLACPP